MNRKVKQVVGFLFLKGALTSRNLTSIGLVLLFFGIYVASGGKIASLPNVSSGGNFGGVKSAIPDQITPQPKQDKLNLEDSYRQPSGLFSDQVNGRSSNTDLSDRLNDENTEDVVNQEDPDDRLSDLLNRLEGMDK